MSKELNHTADIMYELIGNDIIELLEDLFDALNKIFLPLVGGIENHFSYSILNQDIDDILFDIGNYSLNKIYEGFFPSKIEKIENEIKIYFSKIITIKSDIEVKAISYPKIISNDEKYIVNIIFDI
ncbi:archease [Marinitoga sp. 38H-ov]|uniref:archease n=1 Tax=Marinitoga sp. 38H-ov TaxID=1755814 RepID=UPI0013EC006A|nr:archease [Marinitoga sp. 38H-ov]